MKDYILYTMGELPGRPTVWKKLPFEWQNDHDIASRALSCGMIQPQDLPVSLLQSCEFALKVFTTRNNAHSTTCLKLWDLLSIEVHNDRNVAFAAIINKHVSPKKIINLFNINNDNDLMFFVNVIQTNDMIWDTLPITITQNERFCQLITQYTYHLAKCVMETNPILRDNYQIWYTIINSIKDTSSSSLHQLIEQYASLEESSIRNDNKIMMNAFVKDRFVLNIISDRLKIMDQDFLMACVRVCPAALPQYLYITKNRFDHIFVYEIFNTVVATITGSGNNKDIQLLSSSSSYDHMCFLRDILENADQSMWENETLLELWCKMGGYYDNRRHPNSIASNQHFFLLIAKHCNIQDQLINSFKYASNNIRCDKQFILNAVTLNGNVFLAVDPVLQYDIDLAIIAFSQSEGEIIRKYVYGQYCYPRKKFIRKIADTITESIYNTDQRFITFLHGTSAITRHSSNETSSRNHLTLLNQDPDTNTALKRKIADYLGAPVGKKLQTIRLVRNNILKTKLVCRHC